LAKNPEKLEIASMNTVTVDDHQRVRIPDAKPGRQLCSVEKPHSERHLAKYPMEGLPKDAE